MSKIVVAVSRNLSQLILLGTVAAIGLLFFRVIWPFVFPLLFAAILSILFRPVFDWVCSFCRRRIAAAVTTLGVLLIVMIPLAGAFILAGIELVEAGRDIVTAIDFPNDSADAQQLFDPRRHPRLSSWLDPIKTHLSEDNFKRARDIFSDALLSTTKNVYDRTLSLVGDLIALGIGLVMMVLALYYLFADGAELAREARRLSPLEDEDGLALARQFENVCRGVVLSSLVAAVVQGVLAGIGFAVVGVERIWLLSILTMFFSLIPFLGAAAVWICVALVLLFEQRFGAAIFVFAYGMFVVSVSDNLIKAYVIGDRAKLHPFVVLATVLGALQLVGLWGIFIGPMTAAFFYALLNILRKRLLDSGNDRSDQSTNFASDR